MGRSVHLALAENADGGLAVVRRSTGEHAATLSPIRKTKMTLSEQIVGLEQPFSGHVRFEGEAIPIGSRRSKAYRRAVQMVFQDPTGALNPRQTIYEAVAEGIRIQGLHGAEEEASAALRSLRPGAVPRCRLIPSPAARWERGGIPRGEVTDEPLPDRTRHRGSRHDDSVKKPSHAPSP